MLGSVNLDGRCLKKKSPALICHQLYMISVLARQIIKMYVSEKEVRETTALIWERKLQSDDHLPASLLVFMSILSV